MLKRLMTTGLISAIAVLPCALNAAEPAPARSNQQRALDLKAPEIGRIFSLDQINAVLSQAIDPALEFVEVEALRLGDLPLEDNSATAGERVAQTLWWLVAPLQTPVTFQSAFNQTPDATYSHRPEPFVQTDHHASFDQP